MKKDRCRVIVLGASRARLQKVFELLLPPPPQEGGEGGEAPTAASIRLDDGDGDDHDGDGGPAGGSRGEGEEERRAAEAVVEVEFLPCVPAFAAYSDDANGGREVRYLARLDYLGPDARLSPPGTLLPFLEEDLDDSQGGGDGEEEGAGAAKREQAAQAREPPLFGPIAGVVVGGGIGNDGGGDGPVEGGGSGNVLEGGADDPPPRRPRVNGDVELVLRFVESMISQVKQQQQQQQQQQKQQESSCGPSSRQRQQPLPVEVVRPGPGFRTLRDELEAYRSLAGPEREEAARAGAMGPGKVARAARRLAARLVAEAIADAQRRRRTADPPGSLASPDHLQSLETKEGAGGPVAATAAAPDAAAAARGRPGAGLPPLDPAQDRYACRSCRCPLFGREHLQDPPHVPSRHKFSYRKQRHGGSPGGGGPAGACESYFLQSVLPWMAGGGATGAAEGRVGCPRCGAKLGGWNWSGAQCSCGTWVVPAIQVPRSRVDVVVAAAAPASRPPSADGHQHPGYAGLPPGAVVSPVVLLRQRGEMLAASARNGSAGEGGPASAGLRSSRHQQQLSQNS
jgi:hypothetical protein